MRAKKLVILGIDHAHYRAIIAAAGERNDVKLAAIAQETPPYADEAAAKLGVKAYRSYQMCLDEEKPDIVGIAMFNGGRGPWISAALSRGLPVISDKPVCTTPADLEAIRAAHEKSKAPLCMMLTCRNTTVYAGVREAVRSGKIGAVLAIEGCRYYALNRPKRPEWMFCSAAYGGPGMDILIHDYDLARWISGIAWDDIVLTETRTGCYDDPDFNDTAFLYGHDAGRLLALHMLWHSPAGHHHHFAVYGTKGFVEITMAGEAVLKDAQGAIRKLEPPKVQNFAGQFFRALLDRDVDFPISTAETLTVTGNILKAKQRGI